MISDHNLLCTLSTRAKKGSRLSGVELSGFDSWNQNLSIFSICMKIVLCHMTNFKCCFSMLIIKVVTWHCTTILVTLKSVKASANYTQAYKMSISFEHKANPPRFDKIRLFFQIYNLFNTEFLEWFGKNPMSTTKSSVFHNRNFLQKIPLYFLGAKGVGCDKKLRVC